MEIKIDGVGAKSSPFISLKQDHESFQVTYCVVPSADFDGKVGIVLSPDQVTLIPLTEYWQIPANAAKVCNTFKQQMPYAKVLLEAGTKGSVTVYFFGSVIGAAK